MVKNLNAWWFKIVEIKAFKGWTYGNKKIDNFSKVITPPNDVISLKAKDALKSNEYSFVKLILPDGNGDKYDNSSKLFNKWKEEGVMVQDEKPTIYVYSESYQVDGNKFSRMGFMAAMKLEPLGEGMLPHEKVLEKDLKDRIDLIKTTKANFGVPFVLYDDREKLSDAVLTGAVSGLEPYIDFCDANGVCHKLWKVDDSEVITKIVEMMKDYQCIIADGHHRYTSNYKVSQELDIDGAKYGLICFVNSFNEGMVLLPTNRVVSDVNVDFDDLLTKLEKYFEIEEVSKDELVNKMESVEVMIDKVKNLKNHVFGMYSKGKAYLLTLKDRDVLKDKLSEKSDVYQKLDINILHKIVLEEILGITEEMQCLRQGVDFVKGNKETMDNADSEEIAFFVNPPLMREVFLTARAGEVMPQKSTYFYPKVYSGLVVYDFEQN